MKTYQEISDLLEAGLISLDESMALMEETDKACYHELDEKAQREIDRR